MTIFCESDEARRLMELKSYEILDTPEEEGFDDLARIAAQVCDAPTALISLVDERRQWSKARVNLKARETPRDIAFCAHAIMDDRLFVVPDTRLDPRFRENPLVTGPSGIRFYAGAPIVTPSGCRLGTVFVIDQKKRTLSPPQGRVLRLLAKQAMSQLERHKLLVDSIRKARELEATHSRLSSLVDRLPSGILAEDEGGKVLFANDSFCKLFNQPEKASYFVNRYLNWGDRQNEYFASHFSGLTLRKETSQSDVIELTNGYTLKRDYVPIYLDGVYRGQLWVYHDITVHKSNQETILGQRAKLAESAKLAEMGEMAAKIAHEINNPLGIIQAKSACLLELSQHGKLSGDIATHELQRILGVVQRVTKIIKGLRAFSRNDTGEVPKRTEIRDFIDDILGFCQERFRSNGVMLVHDRPVQPLFVTCEPVRTSQVVLNLLNNAYDAVATLPEKWVRITYKEAADRICVAFTDSGKGIPTEDSFLVVSKFFHDQTHRKGHGPGTQPLPGDHERPEGSARARQRFTEHLLCNNAVKRPSNPIIIQALPFSSAR